MEIDLVDVKSGKSIARVGTFVPTSTIKDVKLKLQAKKRYLHPGRQSYRLEPRGKALKDEDTLGGLQVQPDGKLYFKDLGPQVAWTTVFLCEYAGPIAIYLLFYMRPAIIYGEAAPHKPMALVVHIAAACWTFHYVKRLYETIFIHRFSHATMPITNIMKNCSYYWGFAAYVAYYINHPLYTLPMYGDKQIFAGLAGFLFNELGNLSVHIAFRNMRPPGTKERRIPKPSSNPFTWLFSFVSCPNYTYEVGAWVAFSVMTQCLPALLFTTAGFYQMTVWALGKHRNYLREFKDYPRGRRSIVPFII